MHITARIARTAISDTTMNKFQTEEELLDLIDALDAKIDEIDDHVAELQSRIPNLEETAKDRAILEVEQYKRERRRINEIIAGHMKTLKELE